MCVPLKYAFGNGEIFPDYASMCVGVRLCVGGTVDGRSPYGYVLSVTCERFAQRIRAAASYRTSEYTVPKCLFDVVNVRM